MTTSTTSAMTEMCIRSITLMATGSLEDLGQIYHPQGVNRRGQPETHSKAPCSKALRSQALHTRLLPRKLLLNRLLHNKTQPSPISHRHSSQSNSQICHKAQIVFPRVTGSKSSGS